MPCAFPRLVKQLWVDCGPVVHLSGLQEGVLHAGLAERGTNISGAGEWALAFEDGMIIESGPLDDVVENVLGDAYLPRYGSRIDLIGDCEIRRLEGSAVMPGLVDSHTHLVWAGDRSREVSMRHAGMTYSEIASAGGGIHSTVGATRSAKYADLVREAQRRLAVMGQHGTCVVEAKSGYGLDVESELSLLSGIHEASEHTPQEIHATWLGAHDLPPSESDRPRDLQRKEYVDHLISEQLPAVLEQGIASSLDVFCEPGWFDLEDTEMISRAGLRSGLNLRLHVDEFCDGGGAGLAAELGANSADHAHHSSLESRASCQESGVLQTFLPGTPHVLGEMSLPPASTCSENRWAWGLATDYNPNCRIKSLAFIASLAVQRMGVDPLNAAIACTHNPATSLASGSGRLVPGMRADVAVIRGPHWELFSQTPGTSPFELVMAGGSIIHERG